MYQENFIVVSSKNEFIKNKIPYYYFFTTFDPSFFKSFTYFPHYRLALTIYKDSNVTWDSDVRYIRPFPGKNSVLLTKNIKKQQTAIDHGIINKICIAFEPLGINHFIDGYLSDFGMDSLQYFDYFGEPFLIVCEQVFNTTDIDEKVLLLDTFFLERYRPFAEKKLKMAVELLLNNSESLSIQRLSDLLGISRKTLNRMFAKHLCCSPNTCKQIIKFRKTINQHQIPNVSKSLTHLAYDNDYYDQSEFINHCKKLTGLPPKSFFSEIQQIGPVDIYWAIKKQQVSQMTN